MRDALLQAVLDAPDDDAPRLILADWMEEHGGEADRARADFIRTQVDLARPGFHCGGEHCGPGFGHIDCRHEWARKRVERAVDDEDYDWLVPAWTKTKEGDWSWSGDGTKLAIECGSSPYLPDVYAMSLAWRRGWIESVSMLDDDFLIVAGSLFAEHPVTSVELTDREPLCVGPGRFLWIEPGRPRQEDTDDACLPPALYDLLPPPARKQAPYNDLKWALSLACVLYGRAAAKAATWPA